MDENVHELWPQTSALIGRIHTQRRRLEASVWVSANALTADRKRASVVLRRTSPLRVPPKRERDAVEPTLLDKKRRQDLITSRLFSVSLPYESVLKVESIIYSFFSYFFFCRGDTDHLGVLLFKVPYVLTCYGW